MINVELIFPYTIVEENGLYGITDNQGNLVVPCVMDEISNDKEEKVGLQTWSDFNCVIVRKDGKYGFFTSNGKFIEPAYDSYAIDPCGNDIHVRIENDFGVFVSPVYIFEKLLPQYSLLEEIEPYCSDVDIDDVFDEIGNKSLKTWFELEIYKNVISFVKERLHAYGYAFTQELWDSVYNQNGQIDIEKFVDTSLTRVSNDRIIKKAIADIKAQVECDATDFWNIVDGVSESTFLSWCVHMAQRGVASFVTQKNIISANIPLLNSKVDELIKNDGDDGYYSTFNQIDKFLPRPDCHSGDIAPVQFPVGMRPSFCSYPCVNERVSAVIGEIYLYEESPHTYSVRVTVYDSENPETLLYANHSLCGLDVDLSELLVSIQQVVDPAKENTELSAAINKVENLMNCKTAMAQILSDCGIYILSLSDLGHPSRFYDGYTDANVDFLYLLGDDVKLVLESETLEIDIESLMLENCHSYTQLIDDIRIAANTAYERFKIKH